VKSYGQWCSLATALDVVGERWSLLIVRELFDSPKRYTDLRDGIPGIATDVLASRLRDLEDNGIVAKRELPPPAASKVYELTPLGVGLGPTMTELMKWGSQLLGPKTPDLEFRPHWLVLGLKGMLRPNRAADVRLDLDFDIGSDEVIRVHVEDGRLSHVVDPATPPDVVVHGDLTVLTAIADGTVRIPDAAADGRFAMEGDADAIASFQRLFPQPRAVPSAG
jgi:DNA-binding HxlR family transcriptional regulator